MFHIYYGEKATSLEKLACEDLKRDLEITTKKEVRIQLISEHFEEENFNIIVGAPSTNSFIESLCEQKKIPMNTSNPGKRGGCISIIKYKSKFQLIILSGSDAQGCQYAVYDFSRNELGVEPFNFWTGYTPEPIEFSQDLIKPRIIEPPLVPILCYFDNDNDELANMKRPFLEFSFEHWKEIIDSLVRLKYNALDLHDHLGRVEFYERKPYKELRPNYKTNFELIDKVIDYAHQKGMLIQIPMYLGWEFKSISEKARKNWPKYKDEWMNTWEYYLTETPIGKADIFYNRPRDQKWDRPYEGKGDPIEVFTEAFSSMYKIVKEHNSKAIIIYDLYMNGRALFEKGLSPEPKNDIIFAWPNDGFGHIEYYPRDTKGYQFGVYVHAGYYLNHVVHDPYPGVLAQSMKEAFLRHKMTHYCLVNGQTFRHFILNLEVCSLLCDDPENFHPQEFYLDWTARYFGETVKTEVVEVLKLLHATQKNELGYVKLLYNINVIVTALRLMKILIIIPKSLIRKPFIKYGKIGQAFTAQLRDNIEILKNALGKAQQITPKVVDQCHLFHDLIILQIQLLLQLNQIAKNLQLVFLNFKQKKPLVIAIDLIKKHTKTRLKGDRNEK